MVKKINKIPKFKSTEEMAKFWDTHSFADYWDDLKDADMVFDLNKPRDETVVLRLQKEMKMQLEKLARNKGLNLSTLVRMWLLEKMQENLKSSAKLAK